jgi:ABC-2 type transport system permease protein
VDRIDASVLTISRNGPFRDSATTFGALIGSGFRRYATYRQATIAGTFTNIVFGFLRCYVLLAVAEGAAGGLPAGYDAEQLATYVWVGQGLLSVIGIWGWTDLSDRIRTGDIAADMLRPVSPVVSYLAADLGRALYAISVLFAVIICFGCRYLVNASAYWLHDARGPIMIWTLGSGVLGGLYFPLRLLPQEFVLALWLATPLPSLLQTPLDVIAERDGPALQAGLVAVQAGWVVVVLLLAGLVQRRAERRLVVQGG